MSDPSHKLQEVILEKIKQGELRIKPRAYYFLRGLLLTIGVVVIFGLIVFLASFVTFVVRANGMENLPGFGLSGVTALLLSLPWLLITLIAALVVILEMLGRHYSFVYRRPLLYSVFGIIVIGLAGGIAVSEAQVHDQLYNKAETNTLPVAGQLYRHYGMKKLHDTHIGVVVETVDSGLIIEARGGAIYNVEIVPETKMYRAGVITVGDPIMVLGKLRGDIVRALGIRKITNGHIPMLRQLHAGDRFQYRRLDVEVQFNPNPQHSE